ncbi:hypothetical protein MRX96_015126 [Rhipicephalus microplus]
MAAARQCGRGGTGRKEKRAQKRKEWNCRPSPHAMIGRLTRYDNGARRGHWSVVGWEGRFCAFPRYDWKEIWRENVGRAGDEARQRAAMLAPVGSRL